MAVLYRNHHDSILLQGELLARGIPYTVRSGLRFFEQAHIKDVLAYLRIVVNPRDEASWRRLLLAPAGGRSGQGGGDLSSTSPERPTRSRRSRRPRRWRSCRPRARGSSPAFVADLRKIQATDPETNPAAAIAAILKGGYPDTVRLKYERPDNRIADIEQFALLAGQVRQPRAADRRPAPGRRRLRHGLGRRRRAGRGPRPEHDPPGQGPGVVARVHPPADRGELSRIAGPSTSPAARTKSGASSTWPSPGP